MAEAPYAIYRHAKLKSMGLIHASAQHMTRQRDTPNADPARRDQNMVLIGGDDPAADVAALVPALDARGEDGRRLRRSNSVLAIEVLLTASPEWWAAADADAQQAWLDRSTEWLVSEYGRENIAHLRLHGDERTPPYGVHRSSGPGGRGVERPPMDRRRASVRATANGLCRRCGASGAAARG